MDVYVNVTTAADVSENGSMLSHAAVVLFSGADDQVGQFSGGMQVLLAFLISLLVLVTVMGNTLVILAFAVDKNLRSQNNFFLLNLAICDFAVGAVSVPLYMPYFMTGRWMLGRLACKFWLVTDYVVCVTSVFNIVLISYDRFLSVTMTVMYQVHQRKNTHALLKMGMVWILSFLLYGPAIIFWEYVTGASNVPDNQCFTEFIYTWYFLLGASSVDFFLPLISISYFNLCIYWNIRKRSQKRGSCAPQRTITKQNKVKTIKPCTISGNMQEFSLQLEVSKDAATFTEKKVPVSLPFKLNSNFCMNAPAPVPKGSNTSKIKCSSNAKLSRDTKVAKSLTILVCVFVICWAPYTLLMAIRAACHGFCISAYWSEITVWLLWINSSINPFLYPLCHRSFRRAFIKVLCLKKLTRSYET